MGKAVLSAREFFSKVKGAKADLLQEGQLFLERSAGAIQNNFGWQAINIGVLPLLAIILLSLFILYLPISLLVHKAGLMVYLTGLFWGMQSPIL